MTNHKHYDYVQIARMYRRAVEADLPIGQTLATRLGVTPNMARKLVGRARLMGLLRPGVVGRKGEVEQAP